MGSHGDLSGWEELGNSQLLFLWLQLQVQGKRSQRGSGVPRFPDFIVLVGVQVEDCAWLGQKPRRQVEDAQLAWDLPGRPLGPSSSGHRHSPGALPQP